jgi:hypothetical protein
LGIARDAAEVVTDEGAGAPATAHPQSALITHAEPFVDDAVTVLVYAVAGLFTGRPGHPNAVEPAVGCTLENPRLFTGAEPHHARATEPRILVHLAVTVLVDLIASLLHRRAGLGATRRGPVFAADEHAGADTGAHAHAAVVA